MDESIVEKTYDNVSRVTRKRLGLNSNYNTEMTYVLGANNSRTTLLATYRNGSDAAYEYAYDDNGNISSLTRGTTSVTYQYNGANELVREANGLAQKTVQPCTGPRKVNELKKPKVFSKRKGQNRKSVVIYW